jgi:hypothetical protein
LEDAVMSFKWREGLWLRGGRAMAAQPDGARTQFSQLIFGITVVLFLCAD